MDSLIFAFGELLTLFLKIIKEFFKALNLEILYFLK